jgi:Bacterial regulatory proteins, luxR family
VVVGSSVGRGAGAVVGAVGDPAYTAGRIFRRERVGPGVDDSARGLSNAEIAGTLVVGDATIKTHISRILAKLGIHDRAQAVVVAYESGLVQPGTGMPAA